MPKSLLNGVNEVLKKVDILEGDTGLLTSLTDSARQVFIDSAVQALNEVVDELYSISSKPKPQQLAENTITLVTADQDYALQSDLVTLLTEFGLVDSTNNHVIYIDDDEDAYRQLILGDLDQDDTGLPSVAAIRPTDSQLWMDRAPTSVENGRIYKYRYNKELELVLAADTFPFGNAVFRAVVPAAAEIWQRLRHKEFDDAMFAASMGRAARLITQVPVRDSWRPGHSENITDPFEQ